MSTTMRNDQQCELTLVAKDAQGNPAQVEAVEWASSDETIIQLVAQSDDSPDPLKRYARAVGPTGDARVTVTCDADLGEGVSHLTGFAEFTVTGGQATVIELQPGEVTDQTPRSGGRRGRR